jgi:hypothetical protein
MERDRKFSNEEMLDRLKLLYVRNGQLSGLLIDETDAMPSSSAYRHRFGSLIRAYRLIGYNPERDYQYLQINRFLRDMYPQVITDVYSKIENLGGAIERDKTNDLLTINGEFTTSIVIARCRQTALGSLRWVIRIDSGLGPDVTVAIRMNSTNQEHLDYYLLPLIDITRGRLRLAEDNGAVLDTYRFDTLDFFFTMAERTKIRLAA